ncbi:MAG: TrkA family potassium uptake protein [Candidatus Krumholzibacteriia bacterium]
MMKVAVFGLGRFGASAAETLYREGAEVLAMDRNMRMVEAIKDRVSVAVAADATDRDNLVAYDVADMHTALVAIGTNFEASVLVTMLCKDLGVERVIAKAVNPLQERVLREVGADRVILPEEEMGLRLAEHILHGSVIDFVELPAGYSLRRIAVPRRWWRQSIGDLKLLSQERVNLVQILRRGAGADPDAMDEKNGWERVPLPHGEMELRAGDYVDVIGQDSVLERLE